MIEGHARLQGAEAAGAHSSAHIMIIGHLAPPPAELAACACAVKMLSHEWTRQCCRLVAVHAGTASSAAERRWCRIWRARSGLVTGLEAMDRLSTVLACAPFAWDRPLTFGPQAFLREKKTRSSPSRRTKKPFKNELQHRENTRAYTRAWLYGQMCRLLPKASSPA